MDTELSLRYSLQIESPVRTQKKYLCTKLLLNLKANVSLAIVALFLWCGSSRAASV